MDVALLLAINETSSSYTYTGNRPRPLRGRMFTPFPPLPRWGRPSSRGCHGLDPMYHDTASTMRGFIGSYHVE